MKTGFSYRLNNLVANLSDMNFRSDKMTIAAISTAVGEAGIGIVRMSGSKSLEIANKIFKGSVVDKLDEGKNRKMVYGHIIDGSDLIDEVLIAYMKGPHTYTREDVVEVYCHGGIISVKKVLDLILRSGARLAEPGEFTKRAFLNGRLDLSQAEAVMDIINAKTDKSYEASFNQLEGSLAKKITGLREEILNILARVEASIDYPGEDSVEDVAYREIIEKGSYVRDEIDKLIRTSQRGTILRDGLNTVILGKPNVGKSSLLNAILRENKAIVTDIPGTTRDIIEEFINIDGIPLKIIDTAGIRATDDLVEKIGVDKARSLVNKADLVIAVFDASEDLNDEDREIIDLIKNKQALVIINKLDLDKKLNEEYLLKELGDKKIIEASMVKEIGLEELEESIKEMFYSGNLELGSDIVITNIRHKNQLEKAKKNIEDVVEAAEMAVPIDCVEVDLKSCWENLGEISGDTIGEDILDKIFSEFCLGK